MLLAPLAVVLVAFLGPAGGSAASPPSGTWWLGAPLKQHTANTTESSPEDDLFFLIHDELNKNAPFASASRHRAGARALAHSAQQSAYTMPYDGQITDIQVEGGFLIDPSGPPANPVDTMVHFQALSPMANGSYQVNATSGFFQMPASTDRQALAHQISDFHPENLCVHKGDVVDINTEGGFESSQPAYSNGVPLLSFDNNSMSTSAFFHGHNQTGNGAVVHPTTLPVTVLMRVQLAVGSDATPLCPGGTNGVPQNGGSPPPTLDTLPPPVLYDTANVAVLRGVVYIKFPAGSSAHSAQALKGQGFVPLTEARAIPFGSELDTTRGIVRVVTASSSSASGTQQADFQSGVFKLLQSRSQQDQVQLSLIDVRSRRRCRVGKLSRAHAAARRRLSKTSLGLLQGTAKGKYVMSGQYSSATVRGTKWDVRDRCDGTLTRVRRGVVVVRDFRRRKNITVRAGRSYLARAR